MSSAWNALSAQETVLSVSPGRATSSQDGFHLLLSSEALEEKQLKRPPFSLGVEDFLRPWAPESHCGQHCHRPMMKLGSSSFSSSVPDVSSELLDGCSWL